MSQKSSPAIADYLQIPLAVASFVIFRLVRFAMRGLVAQVNRSRRGKMCVWRVVSADFVGKPLALPVFMTKAPRWNPHAIIATAGPLSVKSVIAINTRQANESAEIWGLTIQPLGGGNEVRISSAQETDVQMKTIYVPPGDYTVVMRYYRKRNQVRLPVIQIDGNDKIATMTVDPENNRFYESLSQRSGWLYVCIGFYVYTMLRFADWLPRSFVMKEFLPAGDQGMRYEFGAVRRGNALQIKVRQETLSNYVVYLTCYNRASFPVRSLEINGTECTVDAFEEDSYYLIRLLLRTGRPEITTGELLTVSSILVTDMQRSHA